MIRPMRLLQTSDWQLGLAIKQLGEQAPLAREQRFETARRTMELAKSEGVDFVVLAGDTFDSHEIDNLVVERAVEILSTVADLPVFVLPGNHDPLVAGGVWDRRAWQRRPENVILLEEAAEVTLADGSALFPCPLTQKRSGRDPTAWIPPRADADDRVRIGVAHGSLGVLPKSANFPIASDRCERAGLDHLAVGDWHGYKVVGRCAYSGTIEATSFSEKETGRVLLVEIDDDSKRVEIDARRIGSLDWTEMVPVIRDEGDLSTLRQQLDALGQLENVVLRARVRLDGDLPAALLEDLEDLRRGVEDRVFFSSWSTEIRASWDDELPTGLARELDEALDAVSKKGDPGAPFESFGDVGPEVALEARSLLRRLAAEAAGGDFDSP